jgi:phosphatidylglycerol---prolipoprotein diacylglyceryl transferase
MHPIILTLGSIHIYSYGLMLVLAFLAANWLTVAEAKRRGMDSEAIFNFLFTAFVCGIIGSRLLYILQNIGEYISNPREIIMLQHGGMSWFGGLMLGIAAGVTFLKRKKLPIYQTLDLVAPYLALGQSIGRIGCLLNGCCFGNAPFLPTQVYASLAMLAIFIILRQMQNKPRPSGEIFSAYLLLYAIKRFSIEFWRTDNPAVFHGLTLFQLLSVGMFILGAARFIYLKFSRQAKK